VEVEDGLSGAGADVEDSAVSVFDVALAGDLGGGEMASSDDFCVGGLGFLQSGKMPFWNDEHVSRGLWIDVLEGEDVVVFMNFLCGNLPADDAAEEAVGFGVLRHARKIAWKTVVSSQLSVLSKKPARQRSIAAAVQSAALLVQADYEHCAFGRFGFGG